MDSNTAFTHPNCCEALNLTHLVSHQSDTECKKYLQLIFNADRRSDLWTRIAVLFYIFYFIFFAVSPLDNLHPSLQIKSAL